MHVKILKGPYAGRVGKVVAAGDFNVFGRNVTGVKVNAGLAGPLVLEEGDYKEVPAPDAAPDRFKKIKRKEP